MTSLPKAYFIAMFCEAVLHGMYTVLTGGALYLLLARKTHAQRMAPANLVMTVMTVLMYCMSTIHISLALRVDLIAFFDQHAIEGGLTILDNQGDPLVWIQIMLELLNCLMGDAIVCWRTWVLWGRNWKVLVFPVVCILGGLVSGAGMTHSLANSPDGGELFSGDITIWFGFFGVLTCIANLYSVGMVSFKAWSNARRMKQLKVQISGGTYYTLVLLIVESGALYCIALIITVVLFLMDNNGVYVIADMLNHLTGIYPTIIIVLVCLKITFHDDMARGRTTLAGSSGGTLAQTTRKSRSQSRSNWRVGGKGLSASETLASTTGADAYALRPIKITTTTEQVTWFDGQEGGHPHGADYALGSGKGADIGQAV